MPRLILLPYSWVGHRGKAHNRALVDLIYVCPIFEYVARISLLTILRPSDAYTRR